MPDSSGILVPSLASVLEKELILLAQAVCVLFADQKKPGTEPTEQDEMEEDNQLQEMEQLEEASSFTVRIGDVLCNRNAGREEQNLFQTMLSRSLEAEAQQHRAASKRSEKEVTELRKKLTSSKAKAN